MQSAIDYLHRDFRSFPDRACVPQQVYEGSYFIAGYKGWHKLATMENVQEVLDHTEVRVGDLNRDIGGPLKELGK